MNTIHQIIALADRYVVATGIGRSTLSWRVFNDTKKLRALEAGADIQVRRSDRALRWFSDNWPGDAEWPMDVPRPTPTIPADAS